VSQTDVIVTSGAYSGTAVPTGIAADRFHEKATGIKPLLQMVTEPAQTGTDDSSRARKGIPLWVDLQRKHPESKPHVLINCQLYMRPFREWVTETRSHILHTRCVYCGASVSFAVALAAMPMQATSAATAAQHGLTSNDRGVPDQDNYRV
jgi:hypothetical protein